MRILLWLVLLCTTASRVEGYGDSWPDHQFPQIPSSPRPVSVVTDIINELGVRILQEYGETGNVGNVAFSPTGIGFVLAALYEGSAGPGNEQIAHVLGLPRDRDITRIGLRDIHRRLRSYLSPDGFLGGLTLNRENTRLRSEYEDILKFLGFDFSSVADGGNATDASTPFPESTSSLTSTEASESSTVPIASTEESAATVTSSIADGVTTTTQIPEEVSEASTDAGNGATTTVGSSPDELTTLKSDGDVDKATTAQEISEPPKTTKVVEFTEVTSTTQETTDFSTTPVVTTQSPTTASEVSSRLTEVSSLIPPVEESTVPLLSTQPTTVNTLFGALTTFADQLGAEAVPETTVPSVEEATVTMKSETTTVPSEQPIAIGETTTSMVFESSTTTDAISTVNPEEKESQVEVLDEQEGASEAESSSSSFVESREEFATVTTEKRFTLEPEETVSNEILYDSTTIGIGTTTVGEIDEVKTIASSNLMSSELENLLSSKNENASSEIPTNFSSRTTNLPERRRVRKIRIRDPVVRTLLDTKSTHSKREVAERSELNNSTESKVVWINRIARYSFADRNSDDGPMLHTILQANKDDTIEDTEKLTEDDGKHRGTRSPRGYFPNFPELPNFPVHPDFPGYPEETSWTRKVGGWRVHSPKTGESSQDSTELTFLVNGEDATVVSAATYTVVLPFAFLPNLQALALEFPLDDPRYNILLLLPTDRDGTRRLARDLGHVALTEIRKELQPAWVRAMIPSFMLKGFVTLTPFLQRLGIRDVFEPRAADLSPMTEDVGVYARDVQQSIGVNIRNYMKPDRTHSRNGIFERAGPVSFVAEHPFLFFIIDAETGVSLIAGRIEDPLNSRIL